MKQETYFLFDEKHVHDYTFIATEINNRREYVLKTSKTGNWTHADEELIKAVDTGNGIKILPVDFKISRKELTYSEVEYLHLLLKCIYMHDNNLSQTYKIIKSEVFA